MEGLRFLVLVLSAFLNVAGVVGADEAETLPNSVPPAGDPRLCRTTGSLEPKYRFEVLPGIGWDNLQNKEMGRVIEFNYSKCTTTDDGRYLLPDGVYTIPLKSSKVETFAELIVHWDNYTSTLSRTVNVNAGLHLAHVGISGTFSYEYEGVKSRQHLDKSVTTRIQARYIQYTSKLEPDTPLTETFRNRLYKIAAHLTLNRTRLAQYESQLLVRDYGTHVITSMDVGAALVQVDSLSMDYLRKYESQKSTILASASASFFGVFDFGAGYKQTTTKEQIETYMKSRTSSHIMTYGGPVFRPTNYTASNWSEAVANDLVAMDKSGDPIYYLITEANLPDVPGPTVYNVYDYVKHAVETYYEHNTHRGCTREDAPNFSFQANVDDGSCKPPKTNFTFGGVYQTCSNSGRENLCSGMEQKNPQTGDYSCPDGYEAVPLQTGSKSKAGSERKCHRCWLVAHCCHTDNYVSTAKYTAYWCAATKEVKQNSGFLFGGLYTDQVENLVTQSKSCPLKFYQLTLLGNLRVCISDDYEFGSHYAVPFAGFYSCKAGNPLALKERANLLKGSSMLNAYMLKEGVASYPHSCPIGYSQHLAVIDDQCSINYCVKTGALSMQGLPKIQRPPFMAAPRDIYTIMEQDLVLDDNGIIWTNPERAEKVMPEFLHRLGLQNPGTTMAPASAAQRAASTNQRGGSSDSLSGGSIAAIAISATFACLVVATFVVVRVRRGKVRYREADPWTQPEERRRIIPRESSLPTSAITVSST